MKQINDIPVRRRPQSKDAQAGKANASDEGMRPRRQIWDGDDVSNGAAKAPQPPKSRPASTPLVLRNDQPIEQELEAAKQAQQSGQAVPQPVPVRKPISRDENETVTPRPVSRPRVAEPMNDAPPAEAAPQPSSQRQRSRPIMPPPGAAQVPPASPPGGQVNRARTRILGFHANDAAADPLAAESGDQKAASGGQFPAGWFVIIDGPGRGASFTIGAGVSTIGRGDDQTISLDFGDQSVSRSAHASVAYDEEQNKFFMGHGGKSNVVRRNGAPVLATEEMNHGDTVRIGKTTLRFVAFCGPDFNWEGDAGKVTESGNG